MAPGWKAVNPQAVYGQIEGGAAQSLGLALMQKLRGNFFVNSYVKAKFLTHDPVRMASYDADPLIALRPSV